MLLDQQRFLLLAFLAPLGATDNVARRATLIAAATVAQWAHEVIAVCGGGISCVASALLHALPQAGLHARPEQHFLLLR